MGTWHISPVKSNVVYIIILLYVQIEVPIRLLFYRTILGALFSRTDYYTAAILCL